MSLYLTCEENFNDGHCQTQSWKLLRDAMESEGFTVYEAEWWHFDYKDWQKYPITNVPFDRIGVSEFARNLHDAGLFASAISPSTICEFLLYNAQRTDFHP